MTRKECREKAFETIVLDIRCDKLMLSTPFCLLLFSEDAVSTCLKEICNTHTFPTVAFRLKTTFPEGEEEWQREKKR